MHGSQWLALSFQKRNCTKIFTCPREPYFTLKNEVEDDVKRIDSKLRKAVPTFQRVALTISFLASTPSYSSVANLFGVSRSVVSICVKEVCQIIDIVKRLRSRSITIQKGDDLKQVIATYKGKWGFPMSVGGIEAPSENQRTT